MHPAPATFLPLKPTVLDVLMSLADADGYGYGIMKEVEERTHERIPMRAVAFYWTLFRIVDYGLTRRSRLTDSCVRAWHRRLGRRCR